MQKYITKNGGEGSGNFGHAGVPGQVGGSSSGGDTQGLSIPEQHEIFHKNPGFKLEDDEQLLAHYTLSKNLSSIKAKGLVHGTGESGGVGSAGSTDLWAWSNPQKTLEGIKSKNQGVVIFAAKKKEITSIPGANAVYIKAGSVTPDKIAFITKTKGSKITKNQEIAIMAKKFEGWADEKTPGEAKTGYEPGGDLGEFECENCAFFENGLCGNLNMMRDSKLPKAPDGRVKVDPEGCCEYVHRTGKDKDEDDDMTENDYRGASVGKCQTCGRVGDLRDGVCLMCRNHGGPSNPATNKFIGNGGPGSGRKPGGGTKADFAEGSSQKARAASQKAEGSTNWRDHSAAVFEHKGAAIYHSMAAKADPDNAEHHKSMSKEHQEKADLHQKQADTLYKASFKK